ncbi:hypothetical protein D9615_007570 [Tricholomella constricta]|uniref:Ig-like domain-containing protein n=1 Tax=Tricholomella constricta TaxID=117010 RepID=A0A8H5H7H0_9AGAR|nr:hypothetical protein D9615_007570 [Tricholomella constricta]
MAMVNNTERPIDIFHNPHPEGVLPPPFYRPPSSVVTGRRRTRSCIIGGLLIDNDEGRRWFKDTYNIELADHHREDMNVRLRLIPLLKEKNIDAYSCHTAPRRLEGVVCDWLIVTHIQLGPFVHSGPDYYEEVYDEDVKPVPGVKEEKVKAQLKKEIGIETCGYKSYYSNWYY